MAPRNFGRDAERRTKREAEKAFEDVRSERWTLPDDMDVEEDQERWVDEPTFRVTNRTVRERHTRRIVDYAFIHEIAIDGEWIEVAKIDCAHGDVHKHWPPPDGDGKLQRIVIRPIHSANDVHDSYQASLDEMYDNLEENERTWRDALRF